jgi:hypothetical protein
MYIKNLVILAAGLALVLIFISINICKNHKINDKNRFIMQTITKHSDFIVLTVSSVMLLRIFIKFATIDFEKCLKSTQYPCW